MEETLEIKIDEAWQPALKSWNSPSIPHVITADSKETLQNLGEIGNALQEELAFMKYPQFQTYLNLENIARQFPDDPQRATRAIATHEVGHRFCPYDVVTTIILNHAIKKALQNENLPYNIDAASQNILNLFSDTCINSRQVANANEDIPWAYAQLSKTKEKSKLWNVYARSMEHIWHTSLLPADAKVSKSEEEASKEIAELFQRDYFNKDTWKENSARYARIISKFLEDEKKDGQQGLDNTPAQNIPQHIDEKTAQELAKRVAQIASNGLPKNSQGLKEFQEIMAGYGQGEAKQASIHFYDMLSNAYDVMFATWPLGRPRVNPFQPVKWNPSMGAERLDVDYSAQAGGKMIPGVNTYAWNTRKRDAFGGLEEVVPNLDIYLDSSMSMINPLEQISLPVLAGFVAAKKAHRKGSLVRATNFSGNGQYATQDFTKDLQKIYDILTTHYNGGTVFPTDTLLEGRDPRQSLIITDTFLGNGNEAAEAIATLRKRHPANKVTVYEINPGENGDYLRRAGAEVIQGTTTDIFKRVIGKADEVYTK